MFYENWKLSRTTCLFCDKPSWKIILADWIKHRLCVLIWAMILDALKALFLLWIHISNHWAVNKHNARVGVLETLCAVKEVLVTSEKAMVCCELHNNKKTDPYFFFESNVNYKIYKRMPRYYAMPIILYLPGSPIFSKVALPNNGVLMCDGIWTPKHCNVGLRGSSDSVTRKVTTLDFIQIFICRAMWKSMSFLFKYHLYLIRKKGLNRRLQL